MVNGHELGIDIISPAVRSATKEPSRKPARGGRSLRRGASLIMKSKATLETDDLSNCDEESEWDGHDPVDMPSVSSETMQRICQEFESKLSLIEKKHPLRRKPDYIFSGSDAVSFLVSRGYASSRRIGLAIGRRLAYEFALFEHVGMDFDLLDKADVFYRFTPVEKREIVELCEEAASKGTEQEMPYNIDFIAEVFEEGVEVGPNVFHYRTYKDTFVGRDAVSFLLSHRLARTRQDAVRVGNLLHERGIFQHCCNDHNFKDKFLFYRFVPHKQRIQEQGPGALDSMPVEALAMRFRELVKPSSDPHHPFTNTFCGSAAVDAIIKGRLASSRFEAVQVGQKLAEDLQLFYCVYDNDRPFLDNAHTYYQYYHHDTASLHWLKKEKSRESERGTELMDDEEMSQAGSIEDDDLFNEHTTCQQSTEDENDGKETTVGKHSDADGPLLKMSAFNKSMRLVEDEEENEFNSSGVASIGTVDYNSSVVDALLHEDSTRYFDKYGFAVDNDIEAEVLASATDLHKKYTGCILSDDEWEELLNECSSAPPGTVSKSSLTKMKHAMRMGLADCHRMRAWTLITGVDLLMPEKNGEYDNLVKHGFKTRSNSIAGVANTTRTQTLRGVIERDLHRTFPSHILFSGSNGASDVVDSELSNTRCPYSDLQRDEPDVRSSQMSSSISTSGEIMSPEELCGNSGTAALRRILYAYSVYDPDVGYCQGMNFIAGLFLTFLPEEESFWMLVALMNEEPYNMRSMFLENMSGTHKALYIVDKLIKKYLPKLSKYFQRENIEVSMFATQWIMTVFSSTFPFELVARVWDIFLVEGWKVVYRVIISLLSQASSDLMELTMEEIFDYFRDFSSRVDGHGVILASLNIPMKNKILRKYGDEWGRLQYGPMSRKSSMESNSSGRSGSKTSSVNTPVIYKKRITKKIVPTFVQKKLPFRS
ncbi:hypothetical protein ACHAWO_011618 [Cyclotella atomus]|uniref:Rab-GAP TBC domain-containing protein n=1 Tax=Cyclotella atomus TaxID=382360 RepID=A0ABD3NZU8_9STRA